MSNTIGNNGATSTIAYQKEKEELLKEMQTLQAQLETKSDKPVQTAQEPKDTVSLTDKVGNFTKEHPIATQVGVFSVSALAGYALSKKGGDLSKGIKGFVGGTAGGVLAGTVGGSMAAGMANNYLAPQVAAIAGGPAALATVIGVTLVSGLVSGKIGQTVGSFIGRHI